MIDVFDELFQLCFRLDDFDVDLIVMVFQLFEDGGLLGDAVGEDACDGQALVELVVDGG